VVISLLQQGAHLLTLIIRRQTPADYPAIAALEGMPPEEVAAQAAGSPGFTGLVAVHESGRLLGRASAGFMPHATPAGDLRCLVQVVPAERRHGVGAALWHDLLEAVRPQHPAHLRANGSPHDPESVAWAQRRGFAVTQHLLYQSLDLAALDPAPWAALVAASPFTFVTFDRLRSPAGEQRLHAMYQEYLSHTPDAAESPYQPFAPWREFAFGTEGAWPEGWMVALAPDGCWAGFTMAQLPGPAVAHIYMTGVAPGFRGQGLGMSLKAAAALHARGAGIARMTTLNHVRNAPILAVNRRLGFRVEEEILRLVRPGE